MKIETGLQWLKISLQCPEVILEPVADMLGVLSGSGVEQLPVVEGMSVLSGFFEFAEGANQEEIVERVQQELTPLFALYELPLPVAECAILADEDWATSWQQFFKPFTIIPGLVIKPSWEPYDKQAGEQVIEMDPGMAFGTGKHASTKLALDFIHACYQGNPLARVLDVGTGTGILAMAVVLFGAEEVIAIDNDPEAVRVAVENIDHNDLQRRITTSITDIVDISGKYDLICANIVHNVLVAMAPDFARLLVPGGRLVLAGILRGEQEKNITAVCRQLGIDMEQVAYEDEWAALLLKST